MKKKLIAPVLLCTAAIGLSACASTQNQTTSTNVEDTTVDSENVSEESTDESIVDESGDETETNAEAVQHVVTTKAKYIMDDGFSNDHQQAFENDELGTFLVNVSEYTDMSAEFVDGDEYIITHSPVMTMSEPGIMPQVYGIRNADSEYTDTYATLEDDDEETLTFTGDDGNTFLVHKFGDQDFVVGDDYIITHTPAMTRSNPGQYMDVTRVLNITELNEMEATAEDDAASADGSALASELAPAEMLNDTVESVADPETDTAPQE